MKVQVMDYNLYEYEKTFLINEIQSIGGKITDKITRNSIVDIGDVNSKNTSLLTYIQGFFVRDNFVKSSQYQRESVNGTKRTQSRRYGPHGLHEYKGRFNPQMPRSILFSNFIFKKGCVLDPFMGSGTTLIEARDLGIKSVGVELNPLAYLIAKAKIYFEELDKIPEIKIHDNKKHYYSKDELGYLSKWFPVEQLNDLENIMFAISKHDENTATVYKVILSDLLRDHSLQDPRDLRIRRRLSVPEECNLKEDFVNKVNEFSAKKIKWNEIVKTKKVKSTVVFGDSTKLTNYLDCSICGTVTSPPYATALPYIDTYRLSMVALRLIKHTEIIKTEKSLIGARDISKEDQSNFENNLFSLPTEIINIINDLKGKILCDRGAGFRKLAIPYSLAKYCKLMQKVIDQIYKVEMNEAENFWVVGPNKTRINNDWTIIDTPAIIGILAKYCGFNKVKIIPVQAYHRYNIHSKNSINKESIVYFKK